MAQSSCAVKTRMRTGELGVEMSFSTGEAEFFAGSTARPRKPKLAQAAARTSAEFSPIPAVNTKASIPFKDAIIEPRLERRRCTKMSNASFARAFPRFIAATTSRISPETPEIPSNPDFVFKSSSSILPSKWPCWSRYVRIPGSTEPERVPIMSPSSGVNPMVVSMLTPPRIAASEHPLPRWQVTSLRSERFRPSHCAARPAQY